MRPSRHCVKWDTTFRQVTPGSVRWVMHRASPLILSMESCTEAQIHAPKEAPPAGDLCLKLFDDIDAPDSFSSKILFIASCSHQLFLLRNFSLPRIARSQRKDVRRRQEARGGYDENPQTTGIYILRDIVSRFRRILFGLGLGLLAIAFIIGIALRNTTSTSNPEAISFMAKSDAAMTRMMRAMKISPSGNVDKDFVAMMVPHHQGAIDMASAELSYGHNEPLRGLAQEIISTQQQEIVAMRLYEKGLSASARPCSSH